MHTLFIGGHAYVPGEPGPRTAGVAVEDGRIVAVAPDAQLLAHRTVGTELVDLRGGLVLPGFVDSHAHPLIGGYEAGQCDLGSATDVATTLALVKEYAARSATSWILGGGWSMEHFIGGNPHRSLLDDVVSDRPVAVVSRDHHTLWTNSLALERAGINASTPDPEGGRIERGPDGTPTGVIHERAMELVLDVQPPATSEQVVTGLLRGQDVMASVGVTAWLDARVGAQHGLPDTLDAYLAADAAGSQRAKVTAALWWDPAQGVEQVDELLARRARASSGTGRISASVVKIMVDGIAENRTAALSQPYRDPLGHPTDNHGETFLTTAQLNAAVAAVMAAGFDAHFHTLGDRAVSEALDAIEAASSGRRATLAHLQMVTARDVARFAQLGVAASIQMLWAQPEPQLVELTLPFVHPDLVERHYPFGELHDAGALLAAGSDWPVSSPDPLEAIQVGVLRRDPRHSRTALGPCGHQLDLATALTAATAGAAWALGREHEFGTLTVGSSADLVTLAHNPFTAPPEQIAASRVTSTWIDGVRVHSI
ncbi:hypothetical protein SAMN06264364_11280 [Quadrisphaera granulorum]|uniref:Amidohydrolase 3 domain-containing protein n=1 Tax=Quadrisphaera granulorum TaxID=317664 RepID=A0A316ATL0_9ACTN|nr:amidohydrolase [Quadrisphaera granulorum]PWJ53507.1 hypothetical protein BXY45_11280 [Quadrisphaera granulorum]SZE96849.1 hypothetical protein SAMN06264364_11280 [Quadrisphaera granulorum]